MSAEEWSQSWPDWRDAGAGAGAGRRVELLLSDGRAVSGQLYVDDVGFSGEDEFPIFRVLLDDGTSVSFVDHEKWRFVS